MTAIFRINQGSSGTYGEARQDLALGAAVLEAETKVHATYLWEITSEPEGATTSISGTGHTVNLTLTITGGHLIRLIVDAGLATEDVLELYAGVPLANSGLCIPAFNETIQDNSESSTSTFGYERKLTRVLKWFDQTSLWVRNTVAQPYIVPRHTNDVVRVYSGSVSTAIADSLPGIESHSDVGTGLVIGAEPSEITTIHQNRAGVTFVGGGYSTVIKSQTARSLQIYNANFQAGQETLTQVIVMGNNSESLDRLSLESYGATAPAVTEVIARAGAQNSTLKLWAMGNLGTEPGAVFSIELGHPHTHFLRFFGAHIAQSSWSPPYMRFSDDATDVDAFYTAHGDVSLLRAIASGTGGSGTLLHNELTDLATAFADHPYYIAVDGTRAFTGNQSMGGHNLTGAVKVVGNATVTTSGAELTYALDIGVDYGALGVASGPYFYSGASGVSSWARALSAGTAELMSTRTAGYSQCLVTVNNLFMSNPYFQGSTLWTSDKIRLADSILEVDGLYNLSPIGEKSLIAGILAAATNTGTTYSEGVGIDITSTTISLSHLGIQVLADPGDDRIMYWQEFTNSMKWLSVAGSLSISNGVLTGVDTNTITSLNAGVGAVTGVITFNGSGVSQGGTGNRTFTFTNTTYTAGSFSHGGLANLNVVADHPGYTLVAGTRAFTGNQSMGGHNLTSIGTLAAIGAMNIEDLYRPLSNLTTPLRIAGDSEDYNAFVVAHGQVPLLTALSDFLLVDGTRALGGDWSLGGYTLTNASFFEAVSNGGALSQYSAMFIGTVDGSNNYSGFVSSDETRVGYIEVGVNDTSYGGAGKGYINFGGGEGPLSVNYSEIYASATGIKFSDPNFRSSTFWTSDRISLSGSSAEVTALYNLGTVGEKSLIGGILAAAHLPQYAIAVGDANHYQSGDTTKLSLRNDLGDSLYWLTLSSAFGIAVGQETQFKTTVGSFFFHDSFCNWESVAGIPLSGSEQNWTDLAALIGSEGSLIDGILAAAGSGGGTIEDAYNFGGPGLGGLAFINSGPVHLNNGNATGPNLPILYLTQAYEGATAPWFTISNASTAGAPAILFSGAAGTTYGASDINVIGHKIWTEGDAISIGKGVTTADYVSNSFFQARRYYTNPDGYRSEARIVSRDEYGVKQAEIGCYTRYTYGVPDSSYSAAFISTSGLLLVNAPSGTSFSNNPITNVEQITFEPDSDTLAWSTASQTVDFSNGSPTKRVTLTQNVTSILLVKPVGCGGRYLKIHNPQTVALTFTNFRDSVSASSNFIHWLEGHGNPDQGAITIPAGEICDVSIRYESVSGVPVATGIVVLQ